MTVILKHSVNDLYVLAVTLKLCVDLKIYPSHDYRVILDRLHDELREVIKNLPKEEHDKAETWFIDTVSGQGMNRLINDLLHGKNN